MKAKANITTALSTVAAIAALSSASAQAAEPSESETSEWKEDYAYTLGVQAYIYSYPWVFLTEIRYAWVVANEPKKELANYAPINQFWHGLNITGTEWQSGGGPNNDTLYSTSILDLSKEPIILSHPDMGERYFTFELGSATSDNFAYIGNLTTGSKAGNFALVGPDWKGTLPEGVQLPSQSLGTKHIGAEAKSPTNYAIIAGRTGVLGKEDVPAVNKLQAQYKLTPLSLWGKPDAKLPPADHKVTKPFDRESDPLADWKTINREMTANPPLAQHAALLDMFKTIGIGPGQDVTAMDEATQRGLVRAAKDGRAMVTKIGSSGGSGKIINGWAYPPATMGSAGYFNDITTMSTIQCAMGIISNDSTEAVYINTEKDGEGKPLTGANNYTLKFDAGALPPVDEFWSLTMYGLDRNLVANPIDRYNIGSLMGGFEMADDDSLTLYIQRESPGKEKESNWLPSPEGAFWLVFRTYGPQKPLIDQTWIMPPLEKAK